MNDPLGDLLTRIRNAQMRRRPKVSTPASNLRARELDVLTSEGSALLKRIGSAVKAHCATWEVGVAGHSDSMRIGKASTRRRFPTNWHLSGFRALAAMDYLVKHCGLKPTQVHFRGYAQYHPVASNKTAAGRAKNRRIEIILAPPK